VVFLLVAEAEVVNQGVEVLLGRVAQEQVEREVLVVMLQ